uniref:Uncharacterized protein n=1 Tax=Lepeophtheirus salmonis TaxID=72036 RepID=A0A0K2UZZ3_LEPSM|nr:uncharacterized protein LOC121127897 [Lepeophtheirus salmonis]
MTIKTMIIIGLLMSTLFVHYTNSRKAVNCGFVCYRWRKCKGKLIGLTGSSGNRPSEVGTTGQLFFHKCGSPRDGCICVEEVKEKQKVVVVDVRPHIPNNLVQFINNEAHDWLSNLVQID